MELPSSFLRDISPPHAPKRRKTCGARSSKERLYLLNDARSEPTLADVEAGRAEIEDHLTYFKRHLAKAARTTCTDVPRLTIEDFATLYENNLHQHGHHFVIHQHNHPKAGVHYDLRLQFSATSSVSWAFPKGLPGNPNSRQSGRMAVETRVHNLWNNLIESASMKTGSLLIWDTGTYTVLSRKKDQEEVLSLQTTDDDSDQCAESACTLRGDKHENEKLTEAFKSRYIRLRLHGTRLSKTYTITLRLPSSNDVSMRPAVRRRRSRPLARSRRPSHTSDSDTASTSMNLRRPSASATLGQDEVEDHLDTDTDEDARTWAQNAYPGATNSIGSIHQRRWFVQLDRQSSGFHTRDGVWVRRTLLDGELSGFEPFVVRGRDNERSVVTGRLARDVESDEGCEAYVGRGGWKSIDN